MAHQTDTEAAFAVMPVFWSKIVGMNPVVPAFLSSFQATRDSQSQRVITSMEAPNAASSPDVSVDLVLSAAQQVAGEAISTDIPLWDLASIRLAPIELRNHLQNLTNMHLPGTLLFNYPTVRKLTMLLSIPSAAASADPTISVAAMSERSFEPVPVAAAGFSVQLLWYDPADKYLAHGCCRWSCGY